MALKLEEYESLQALLEKFYNDETDRCCEFVNRAKSDSGFAMRFAFTGEQLDKIVDVKDWVKSRITSLKYSAKPS